LPKKKKPSQKRIGGMAQGVDPEFKPQYHKKKKKREGREIQKGAWWHRWNLEAESVLLFSRCF
jgi:hypothetical protein